VDTLTSNGTRSFSDAGKTVYLDTFGYKDFALRTLFNPHLRVSLHLVLKIARRQKKVNQYWKRYWIKVDSTQAPEQTLLNDKLPCSRSVLLSLKEMSQKNQSANGQPRSNSSARFFLSSNAASPFHGFMAEAVSRTPQILARSVTECIRYFLYIAFWLQLWLQLYLSKRSQTDLAIFLYVLEYACPLAFGS